MPSRYDEQTKAKAIRLVREHADDYGSEWEAITTVSGRLGMSRETLRKWLRQAEVDAGDRDGVTTAIVRENRELKRKNAEAARDCGKQRPRRRHRRRLGRGGGGVAGSRLCVLPRRGAA